MLNQLRSTQPDLFTLAAPIAAATLVLIAILIAATKAGGKLGDKLSYYQAYAELLEDLIAGGTPLCYLSGCQQPRLHANHRDSILREGIYAPEETGYYSTYAANFLTEEEILALRNGHTTTYQHHYLPATMIFLPDYEQVTANNREERNN